MKTVALVSPDSSGHHQTYLRLFTQAVAEQGHAVVAFTPEPADLLDWVSRASPQLSGRVTAFALSYQRRYRVPGPLRVFFDKLAWVRFVGLQIRRRGVAPDLVFHTWLDNCLTPGLTAGLTDLFFPYRWSGIYFHPWYLREPMQFAALRQGPLLNHDALRSSRCQAVAVLDEGSAPRLQALLGDKPVIVFPDMADDSPPDPAFPPVMRIRARAGGRKIVALLGVLARRKGLLTLLEVARRASREPWFFVFAGEFHADSFTAAEQTLIADFVRAEPDNCYFHFQRIPDEPQFNALVAVCDVLFAIYQHFLSSSNLLAKAALFEKPILVSERYCMGERVRSYGIGLAIPEDDAAACAAALSQLSAQLDHGGGPAPANFAAYRQAHSKARLRAAFA
ncbi:MAG: hypothetical protein QG637_25, partial [Chloroflexota bacterium]|nr:hypothetical protein [Chloroflexota bacterium]